MEDFAELVKVIDCENWAALGSNFDEMSSARCTPNSEGNHLWIYRGQKKFRWWLKPSIERLRDQIEMSLSLRALEDALRSDFQGKAAHFLDRIPEPSDDIEWLALMQHHAVPTRLLDWTYSPAVATYFALRDAFPDEEAPEPGQAYCSVWAINLSVLRSRIAGRAAGIGREGRIEPVLPRRHNTRLSAQQGLFLMNNSFDAPFMQTLHSVEPLHNGEFIRRFKIPWSSRVAVLAQLLEHNVHEVALFPGLDGLGRFVALKAQIQGATLGFG